jgi:hypothetical protein
VRSQNGFRIFYFLFFGWPSKALYNCTWFFHLGTWHILIFCEENAGPELGFDSRVCGQGQIMPNLWKERNQMCCASWVMYEVIKEHDSGLEHHQRALGQN